MSYALASRRQQGLGCPCGMAGLGELVTPDRWFWMPGDIRAWLNQINEQIRSMGNDIETNRTRIQAASGGPRFISDFEALRTRWLRFNRDAASWWGNTVAEAQEYVNLYNALEERYQAIVGTAPTAASRLSREEAPSVIRSANYALMGWAVIGIVGVAAAGYLLNNYARVKTLSKLAFNRRRRRRSR